MPMHDCPTCRCGKPTEPNPLVNRADLTRFGHRHLSFIAEATGEDAASIMARASTGGGKLRMPAQIRFERMSDDRLALTVADLKAEHMRLLAEQGRQERANTLAGLDPHDAAQRFLSTLKGLSKTLEFAKERFPDWCDSARIVNLAARNSTWAVVKASLPTEATE